MTIRRGDILWADLGMFPTTSVQGGVRPVIVVSNNKANTYSSVITVVPLTSRIYKKRYLPTHVFISKYDMTGIRKGSLALAEQVILQLPKNYDTISIDFGIDKNEMKRLVIALAELDLTIDEWLCFKMKELILANRLSKENRGEE